MNAIQRVVSRAREVRVQPYWDTKSLAATPADVTFFSALPTAAVGSVGQNNVTNMSVGGQLPSPKQLRVHGISLSFTSFQAANKVGDAILALLGILILTIADKEYLRLMGWMAPQAGGAYSQHGMTASTETTPYVSNGQTLTYNYFKIRPAILIPTQQNFKVAYNGYPTLSAAVVVQCTLWGVEERAVQ